MDCGKRDVFSNNHFEGMYKIIQHCVGNHNEELILVPKGNWNESNNENMAITGRVNSNFSNIKDDCKRLLVALNHVWMDCRQPLSKSLGGWWRELFAETACTEDRIFVMYVTESIRVQVEKPIQLPKGSWNGIKNKNMVMITGRSDSYFRKNKNDCKIVVFSGIEPCLSGLTTTF